MGRFSRRSASGYYRPLGNLSAYGIGLSDPLTASTNWTKQVSTDPFAFTVAGLTTTDNDAHSDFMYYTPSPTMTDQFSQMKWKGITTHGGIPQTSGGVIVRHQNLGGWPAVKGYYFVLIYTGSYTYEMGRYVQSGGTIARTATLSGAFSPVANDVYKLEAIGSGTVTVTVYVNGVSFTAFSDSSGARSLSGFPGIIGGVQAAGSGTLFTWDTWRGGAISPTLPTVYQQQRGSGIWLGVR